MSDLYETREKVEKGADWRGNIQVEIDGDVKDLTIRQLRDTEFWEVMSMIDTDELEQLQESIPEEVQDELEELQEADELTEEDEERLEELQSEMDEDSMDMFEVLSEETFKGLSQCAIYGVEPDGQDIQRTLTNRTKEVKKKYGGTSHEDARQYVNDHVITPMIENSTNFTSFSIGVRVFSETLDRMGN